MQLIDGRFVYAASDVNNYLECLRLNELDALAALGEMAKPQTRDERAELLARKGDEHERRHLAQLQSQHAGGVVVFEERAPNTDAGLREAEARTLAAMESGARVIYQATFYDGAFLGRADFLRRVETPGARFPWSYEVVDTKLALAPKPYFLIQLCNYSEHLERLTGTAPRFGHIVLGSGEERSFRIGDFAAYYRSIKTAFIEHAQNVARNGSGAYPFACSHCMLCVWNDVCEAQRDRDDHLGLVAFLRNDQLRKFEKAGIATIADLAAATDDARPMGMAERTFADLRNQAALQHRQREAIREHEAQRYFYDLRPAAPDAGLALLPQPSPGDVYFDLEGDPLYRADRALEYLWGYYLADEDRYEVIWALDPAQERAAFEAFVDFLTERLKRHPDLHVYHYAPYETSVLKRLMGRYASRENEVNALLVQGVFVDLYKVVRQALWVSQPSYSIKKLEPFYDFTRTANVRRGDDSIVMFETWLATQEPGILEDIRLYNDEDCRSTHALHRWLLQRRNDLQASLAEPIPWWAPRAQEQKPDEASAEEHALLDGLPQPDSLSELRAAAEPVRARWMLGNLLRYHRREARPDWWKYYHRCENVKELMEHDHEALGDLHLLDVPPRKLKPRDQNLVYTYEFPQQEFRLSGKVHDPDLRCQAGEIVAIDEQRRRLEIKLGKAITPERLRALIPGTPISDKMKRERMEEIAQLYLTGELQAHSPATYDLLLAHPPRIGRATVQPADVSKERVSETIDALQGGCLPIQGPPGTGKSTKAAWAIVDLLQRGKRVGIMAYSHKAVHNLLRKVEETAHARRFRFSGCHKESETEGSTYDAYDPWSMVESSDSVSAFLHPDCLLASGTTYAWADGSLPGTFDYLFIDEAGQICLADALVASRAARNVVLLGDPQQLPQVKAGSHPVGADLSVLEHLLGDARTIAPERGIFLDVSYRMHPEICVFLSEAIYDGRLHAAASTGRNRVDSLGLSGSGLFYLPVAHDGNRTRSDEEAAAIVREIDALLRGTVTLGDAAPRTLTEADILVVAPYNMQRIRITELLQRAGQSGVRVGTVDKFQGQEAPVVFYSMAASSAEHAPRGLNFLFNRNRFNVAISRAQCMSVLAGSPTLLRAHCTTIENMSLVNLLCRFAEEAHSAPCPEAAPA